MIDKYLKEISTKADLPAQVVIAIIVSHHFLNHLTPKNKLIAVTARVTTKASNRITKLAKLLKVSKNAVISGFLMDFIKSE